MNLVAIKEAYKSYGNKVLFNNISLNINDGEKIGLVGVNGTGKSTLLKVIAGEESFDKGEIISANNIRIEYLCQDPEFDANITVLDQIFKSDSKELQILREYENVLSKIEGGNQTLNSRLIELQEIIEINNLWNMESEIKSILTKLNITRFEELMGNLSGGQRKRVALAAALISDCDLLVLDEPTNHMDSDLIQWMEDYLNSRKNALLMVTHDRYFLDRVTNNIIELDNGNLFRYKGNYTYFIEEKINRESIESSENIKREKLYKKELAWMRKGAKARTTKQKARKDRFEDIKENLKDESESNVELIINGSRLGKSIIELKNISKEYDGKVLFDDFSYIFQKNDRIGIIGANGAGKSTLIKIIKGETVQDSGEIIVGKTVKTGYFSQENEELDDNKKVIDYIKETAEFLSLSNGDKISASKLLERFLFMGDTQYNFIGRLSGGEKRRLYLLKILMSAPNVFLLDEPTNDLDIITLAVLEDFLDEFSGPVVAISHDRYFLDRICNIIFSFENDGNIKIYHGNYSDFNEKKKLEKDNVIADEDSLEIKKKDEYRLNKTKKLKFTYHEQKEFDEIENLIGDIEKELVVLESKIEANSRDYVVLQELIAEKNNLANELEVKFERWEYLNDLNEKINEEK